MGFSLFSVFFFIFFIFLPKMHLLCQDLSMAVALPLPFMTCIQRTDPHGAFQGNVMGFLHCTEKLWLLPPSLFGVGGEIGFLWLCF